MSRAASNGGHPPELTPLPLPVSIDVSWAGPDIANVGFCLGLENGGFLFTDVYGNPRMEPSNGAFSKEPVNGFARWKTSFAISTRSDITLWHLRNNDSSQVIVCPVGAHGIIATESGYFVASAGKIGLIVLKAGPGTQDVTLLSPPDSSFIFYRAICLRRPDGQEILACAGRIGCIGALEFKGDARNVGMSTIDFKHLDIVDICPLAPGSNSLGIAAVGSDGSLVFCRDVLEEQKPDTLCYRQVEGVIYRLLSSRGHLFLLTSKALYVLGDLGAKFLRGEAIQNVPIRVLSFNIEAIDANICVDRWLLLVTPAGVLRADVEEISAWVAGEGLPEEGKPSAQDAAAPLLPRSLRPSLNEMKPTRLDPHWNRRQTGMQREAVTVS